MFKETKQDASLKTVAINNIQHIVTYRDGISVQYRLCIPFSLESFLATERIYSITKSYVQLSLKKNLSDLNSAVIKTNLKVFITFKSINLSLQGCSFSSQLYLDIYPYPFLQLLNEVH